MTIFVLGIDLGKNVCSLVGLDEAGAVVLRRRLRREGVADFVCTLPACIVAMEACCAYTCWRIPAFVCTQTKHIRAVRLQRLSVPATIFTCDIGSIQAGLRGQFLLRHAFAVTHPSQVLRHHSSQLHSRDGTECAVNSDAV